MGRVRVAVAFGLLGAALAVMPATDRRASRPWAEEVLEWVAARNAAADLGVANLVRYAAPDIAVERAPWSTFVGRDEYAAYLEQAFDGLLGRRVHIERTYVDTGGAVVEYGEWAGLMVLEIDPHGLEVRERRADSTRGWNLETPAAVAGRVLIAAYLRAWSDADRDAVAALYAPAAEVEDSLAGMHLRGRAAIAREAERAALTLRAQRRDGSWPSHPRFAPVVPDSTPVEAYFAISPSDGPFTGPLELSGVVFTVAADDGSGCPGRGAVVLTVADDVIVHERRYREVASVRRCEDTRRLPSGWWTGLRPIPAYDDTVAAMVRVDGRRIEIRNGAPGLARLVEWAMGRFARADLAPPTVHSVTFDENGHPDACAGAGSGRALDVDDEATLFVCVRSDDACLDASCDAFAQTARLLTLHELSHAWIAQNVDPATRRAFVRRMGVEAWSDPDVRWHDRGVERAAQVIAWGLMDEPVTTVRLEDVPCTELGAAFLLLTGAAPLQSGCPAPP